MPELMRPSEVCIKCGHNQFLHADYDFTGETPHCCKCDLFRPFTSIKYLVARLEWILEFEHESLSNTTKFELETLIKEWKI